MLRRRPGGLPYPQTQLAQPEVPSSVQPPPLQSEYQWGTHELAVKSSEIRSSVFICTAALFAVAAANPKPVFAVGTPQEYRDVQSATFGPTAALIASQPRAPYPAKFSVDPQYPELIPSQVWPVDIPLRLQAPPNRPAIIGIPLQSQEEFASSVKTPTAALIASQPRAPYPLLVVGVPLQSPEQPFSTVFTPTAAKIVSQPRAPYPAFVTGIPAQSAEQPQSSVTPHFFAPAIATTAPFPFVQTFPQERTELIISQAWGPQPYSVTYFLSQKTYTDPQDALEPRSAVFVPFQAPAAAQAPPNRPTPQNVVESTEQPQSAVLGPNAAQRVSQPRPPRPAIVLTDPQPFQSPPSQFYPATLIVSQPRAPYPLFVSGIPLQSPEQPQSVTYTPFFAPAIAQNPAFLTQLYAAPQPLEQYENNGSVVWPLNAAQLPNFIPPPIGPPQALPTGTLLPGVPPPLARGEELGRGMGPHKRPGQVFGEQDPVSPFLTSRADAILSPSVAPPLAALVQVSLPFHKDIQTEAVATARERELILALIAFGLID